MEIIITFIIASITFICGFYFGIKEKKPSIEPLSQEAKEKKEKIERALGNLMAYDEIKAVRRK